MGANSFAGGQGAAADAAVCDAVAAELAHDAAGVLNTYTLDLDQLSVKAPGQEVLGGFESYDVVLPRDTEGCFISICSETALHRLEFADATFVNQ